MFHKQHALPIILSMVLVIALGTIATSAQEASIQVLAWIGSGTAPGQHSVDSPGQIVYISGEDQSEVLFDLPSGTRRVAPCTEQATSPDNRYFAFFVGDETGTIYLVDGTNSPVAVVTEVSALACLGMGTFQYAPDSSRFGYIDYTTNIATSTYASGWLYIHDAATHEITFTTDQETSSSDDNVTAFDLSADALAFVSLYSDAEEAAVYYETEGYPVEVSTLYAEDGCYFRSIQIVIVNDNTLALIVGKSCPGVNAEWALYTVNIAERSTNRTLATGDVGGSYFAAARSNSMLVSPDTETLWFTHPDGFAQNSTNVQFVDLTNIEIGAALFNNAIVPQYTPNILYPRTVNARPVIALDGSWFAISTNSANNDAAIQAIELDAPDLEPITIAAQNRGETVSAMAFTPDASTLLYVIGGNSAENNSLFAVNLMEAAERRVMRGRFGQQMAVSPDGQYVALPGWRVVNAPNQPNYLTLTIVNLDTGEPITVFSGADVIDNVVSNQQFVYPLSWRG